MRRETIEREAARRLHEALRVEVLAAVPGHPALRDECILCHGRWRPRGPESHHGPCLAAPDGLETLLAGIAARRGGNGQGGGA